jgi:predicted metal-dependent enzyme (double-stranded beta helix superfamily)
MDDGGVDARADLRLVEEKRLNLANITSLVPPTGDIHQKRTISDIRSVSLNLLGNDIGCQPRHVYDIETNAVADFQSGYVTADCDPQPGD